MSIEEEREELQQAIGRAEDKLNYSESRLRLYLLVPASIFLLAIAVYAYARYFGDDANLISSEKIAFTWIVTAFGFAMALGAWMNTHTAPLKLEIERFERKTRNLERLYGGTASPQEPTSYFDRLVQINVDNLADYYAMVRVHTDKSFKVSIIAGLFGFALISVGLILGFLGDTANTDIALIASGSGVITEFIAGIFFYLYNRTIVQLKGYHDSLLTVQNVLLSFKLIGDLKDETQKGQMIGNMLSFLIERKAPSANLTEPSAEASSDPA